MAGQLTIDTLKASSGVLATQNGMTGIAKAWVNFNGNSGSVAIRASFNISSVTRSSAGTYVLSFTTNMADVNYAVSGSASTATDTAANSGRSVVVPIYNTNNFTLLTQIGVGGANDFTYVNAIVCGN